MKQLHRFVIIVGLLLGGSLLQALPAAAGKLDQHASLLADENTAVSFAGKSSCRIERPLVAYTDPETKVVRRIPAIVPPPRCLNAEERRLHEQVNAGLKPLHDLYGKKRQAARKQSKAKPQTAVTKDDSSSEATSVMHPTGMLLPKLSPEALAVLPANTRMALEVAAGNFTSLLPPTQPTPQAGIQHGPVVRTSNGAAATTLPPEVQAAYDAANQLTQFNSVTPNVTHDANGNLTSITDATGTTTFTYDARNRLIARNGPGINETYRKLPRQGDNVKGELLAIC